MLHHFPTKHIPIKTSFFKSWPFDWFPKWSRCFQLWFQVTAIGPYPRSRLEEPGRWLAGKRIFSGMLTLLETNISHLKIDGWNTIVSFLGGGFLAGEFAVSFRERKSMRFKVRTVAYKTTPQVKPMVKNPGNGWDSEFGRSNFQGPFPGDATPHFQVNQFLSNLVSILLWKISIQPKKEPNWNIMSPSIHLYVFVGSSQFIFPATCISFSITSSFSNLLASPTLVALFLHQRRMPKILDSNQREEAEINKNNEKNSSPFNMNPTISL